MGLLTLEAIGPNGEQLAMTAGKKRDIPVGWDEEFQCATFDAGGIDDDELQQVVFEELAAIDPSWQDHLKVAE